MSIIIARYFNLVLVKLIPKTRDTSINHDMQFINRHITNPIVETNKSKSAFEPKTLDHQVSAEMAVCCCHLLIERPPGLLYYQNFERFVSPKSVYLIQ